MGQVEVYNYMKKQNEALSRTEIAEGMINEGFNEPLLTMKSKVSTSLSKLIKAKEVGYTEIDRIKAMERTEDRGSSKVKQRMRLYFVL